MLDDFYKKINVIREFDIRKETIDIINENGDLLTQLLKRQLMSGRDGDKENVTIFGREVYARETIREKFERGKGIGAITQWITNYMSGKFYSSIYVAAIGEEFVFDSDVEYFDEIILRSGERIMELDDEHLSYFSEEILIPQIQKRFELLFNS